MPIYEWYCPECRIKWERTLRMSDDLPKKTKCPECNKLSERLFEQATPVIFRGGGWSDPVKNMTYYKKGAGDEISQELMASSKRRQSTANQHYSRMELDPDKWNRAADNSTLEKDKTGAKLTRLSPTGQVEKQQKSKVLTSEVYDKHGKGQGPHNPNVKTQ